MPDWFKGRGFLNKSDEIEQLTLAINEQSADQRKAVDAFSKAMSAFATDRSLESCLDALNASMQIANIRGKLVESYEYYARLMEQEVIRLNRLAGREDK